MKKLEELGISPTPWWVSDDADGAVNNAVLCLDPTHWDKLFDWDVVKSTMIDGKYDYDDPRHEQEHKKFLANARLIAAAPELYECLRDAVIETCHNFECCGDAPNFECNEPDGRCFVQRWRAALAKAEGGEQ